jgi:hypothetical protein
MFMSNRSPLSPDQSLPAGQPILAPGEIIIGRLVSLDAKGNPMVDYDCNPDSIPQAAVSTLAVHHQHLGRQVALLFAAADLRRPVIMGFIHNPLDDLLESFAPSEQEPGGVLDVQLNGQTLAQEEAVKVDGRQVVIQGEDQIVLKCGESSITLTKAGKIIIRGKYLLSRASGVNRILGGSVQVN